MCIFKILDAFVSRISDSSKFAEISENLVINENSETWEQPEFIVVRDKKEDLTVTWI